MKIGILSSGGDCPGINAAIRGVGKCSMLHFGMEVIGIHNGFKGLLEKDVQVFNERSLSGILNLGGTILGTSREKPFRKQLQASESDKPQVILDNYRQLGLDALVCIGGNGTQKTANLLANIGLNVVGVPKTIDNDIWGTDITFGFDTAVNIATESIDRLHSTASSHKRVMVVEVMGHHAGWIALYAGMAGAADVILMPELAYDMDRVNELLSERARQGKPYSIVVVAEGLKTPVKAIFHSQRTGMRSASTRRSGGSSAITCRTTASTRRASASRFSLSSFRFMEMSPDAHAQTSMTPAVGRAFSTAHRTR